MQNDSLQDFERAVALALVKVRDLASQGALPPVLEALTLIAPPRGFRIHVELKPYADHARQDDPAQLQWDPRNGEVHLAYEPSRDERDDRGGWRDERPPREERGWQDDGPRGAPAAPPDQDQAIRDIIVVVARAESDPAFKFLALKYLRDQLLPRNVAWGNLPHEGQIQINRAIDAGALTTSKVENPRMPQYPVTAVALNRSSPLVLQTLAAAGVAAFHGDESGGAPPPAGNAPGPDDDEPT